MQHSQAFYVILEASIDFRQAVVDKSAAVASILLLRSMYLLGINAEIVQG